MCSLNVPQNKGSYSSCHLINPSFSLMAPLRAQTYLQQLLCVHESLKHFLLKEREEIMLQACKLVILQQNFTKLYSMVRQFISTLNTSFRNPYSFQTPIVIFNISANTLLSRMTEISTSANSTQRKNLQRIESKISDIVT